MKATGAEVTNVNINIDMHRTRSLALSTKQNED